MMLICNYKKKVAVMGVSSGRLGQNNDHVVSAAGQDITHEIAR
jgi:hypothetical protein